MSHPFIKGVAENLTKAEITFDKFHVMQMINGAVDETRRTESKVRPELKRSRDVWLKNENNLSAEGRETLAALSSLHLKTAGAYPLRCAIQEVYAQPTRGWAELMMDKWDSWAMRSRIEPMKDVSRTIRHHRDGILAWFDSRIANGLIEGINSVVQAAKAKARGYRNKKALTAMTYLIAGKLDLRLPT
jgi:transposase